MSKFLYNLGLDDWEQFKVQREPGETTHWRVKPFVIEPRSGEYLKHKLDGRDTGLGTFTGLYYRATHPSYAGRVESAYDWHPKKAEFEWLPMMSDTKAEITDHFEFIDKCMFPGNEDLSVLITGLGLGMVAEACLRAGVGHVTVVDSDPEVISLIAGQIDHPNLRVVEHDAYTWEPDRTFDLAWHDIWATIAADNYPEMLAMKRHYRRHVTYWQGCWLFERVKWMVRRERQDPTGIMRMLHDPFADARAVMLFIEAQTEPEKVWKHLSSVAGDNPERQTYVRHLFHQMTGKAAPGWWLP